MQKLSNLDAAFIYLESPRSPMHVGGVYIFDAADKSPFTFFDFRDHLETRLNTARTFRQHLVTVPLNLDHPYWIDEPHFNLDAHLTHRSLAHPGDQQALMELAGDIFSQPLDMQRPLWHITFVEGLNAVKGVAHGSFALIIKVHHAAVDGVSGEEMVWALLDTTPQNPETRNPLPWNPEPPPNPLQLLTRIASTTISQPFHLANKARQITGSTVQLIKERLLKNTPLPALPLTAPATPFNVAVTDKRIFRGIAFRLQQVTALRRIVPGTTVNDVLLAICAGALRRYLDRTQSTPTKSLIAMVPISTRPKGKLSEMGNQVSAMLVSLATQEDDPLKRLEFIHASVTNAKTYTQNFRPEKFLEAIPSPLATPAFRLYCHLHGPERWGPFFNLFITNVPGPRQTFYLGGTPLVYSFGMAPVFDGLGLILVITSYRDTLSVSVTACQKIMPDIDDFQNDLQASFDELTVLLERLTI
jgi:WS/DGAT/MGAT family acyltransferase